MYLDDVLVSGTSLSDDLRNLQVVLERMLMKGICLCKEKYKFLEEELVYQLAVLVYLIILLLYAL